MISPSPPTPQLETTGGAFTLQEYRLRHERREWTVLHTGAVLSFDDEQRVIGLKDNRLPYGVSLWPSSIALAHEIAAREPEFAGRRILELGAGTGLPGIVAATLGATVVQTDRDELALQLCRQNGGRNNASAIDYRLADWTEWREVGRHDWIIGSDIFYGESLHPQLLRIFETNLGEGGRVLVADPFRPMSLRFLESMERDGWQVRYNQWDVTEAEDPRPVGVFELRPPGSHHDPDSTQSPSLVTG